MIRLLSFAALAALTVPAAAAPPADLAGVEAEVAHAEAVEAVKRLTYMFGYYRDARQYDAAQSLLADDATFDFANGQYVGKVSIARLLRSARFNVAGAGGRSDDPAVLREHVMMQPAITIDADGAGASARFKELIFEGIHGQSQVYAIGITENRYARDANGVWRISAVRYCDRLRMPYRAGVFELPDRPMPKPVPAFYPGDPEGPDRQSSFACHLYPDVGLNPPFHFDHPVTGERLQKP